MAKTSVRNIKLVGFAGVGVVAVGGVVLGVLPLIGQLGNNNEDINSANQQTSQLRTQIQQLQGVQQNEAQVNQFKEDFVAKFPETAQVPDLINAIAGAAVDAGIPASDITNYGFQAPAVGSATAGGTASTGASGAAGSTGAAATGTNGAAGSAAGASSTAPSTGSGATTGSTGAATGGSALGGATTGQAASMTLNLTVTGNTNKFAQFLSNITDMDRNFSVTTFAVAGGSQGAPATLTLTGTTLLYSHITTPQEAPSSGTGTTGATGGTTGSSATTSTTAPAIGN